jgi:hypothetical protein
MQLTADRQLRKKKSASSRPQSVPRSWLKPSKTQDGAHAVRPGSLARLLLAARTAPQFGVPEAVALALFGVVVAWCSAKHVSWFDEVQAWLIARDSTLPDLLIRRLHYEGSPGLWHLLLWGLARCGAPFAAMHALAALIAVAGAAVWLRWNRLPHIPALLMPFTYFFLYQYAVVARNYTLAPLFCFTLMALYCKKQSSPVLFALVAGLCANASVHMAALAAGLAVAYGVDRLRRRKAGERWHIRLVPAAAVFSLLLVLAAAQAFPTADGSSTTANPIVTALRRSTTAAAPKDASQPGEEVISAAQLNLAPATGLAARVRNLLAGDESERIFGLHPDPRLVRHLLVFLSALTVPISTSNAVGVAFFLLVVVCLAAARRLELLLPWLFVQAVNVLVVGEAHHLGLLWIALVCALWGLAAQVPAAGPPRFVWSATLVLLVGIEMAQIFWSAHAIAGDLRAPYSGSAATAQFFESLPAGTRVAAFDDDSITVNAYLPHSPYFNQTSSYWPFSKSRDPDNWIAETMARRPDVVSVKMSIPDRPALEQWVPLSSPGTEYTAPELLALLRADGYRETHRFCGRRYFRDRSEGLDCRLIFEPAAESAQSR